MAHLLAWAEGLHRSPLAVSRFQKAGFVIAFDFLHYTGLRGFVKMEGRPFHACLINSEIFLFLPIPERAPWPLRRPPQLCWKYVYETGVAVFSVRAVWKMLHIPTAVILFSAIFPAQRSKTHVPITAPVSKSTVAPLSDA